jgi:hypothetical protein
MVKMVSPTSEHVPVIKMLEKFTGTEEGKVQTFGWLEVILTSFGMPRMVEKEVVLLAVAVSSCYGEKKLVCLPATTVIKASVGRGRIQGLTIRTEIVCVAAPGLLSSMVAVESKGPAAPRTRPLIRF